MTDQPWKHSHLGMDVKEPGACRACDHHRVLTGGDPDEFVNGSTQHEGMFLFQCTVSWYAHPEDRHDAVPTICDVAVNSYSMASAIRSASLYVLSRQPVDPVTGRQSLTAHAIEVRPQYSTEVYDYRWLPAIDIDQSTVNTLIAWLGVGPCTVVRVKVPQ